MRKGLSVVLTVGILGAAAAGTRQLVAWAGIGGIYSDLGVSWLALFTPLQHWIERPRRDQGGGLRFAPGPSRPVPINEYNVSWYVLLGWALLTLTLAVQLSSFIAGALYALMGGDDLAGFDVVAASVVVTLYPVAVYLAGRWIGTQADRLAPLTIMLASIGAQAVGTVLTFSVLTRDEINQVLGGEPNAELYTFAAIESFTFGLMIGATAGLLGVWRGRRRRVAAYVSFLLRRVPPESRNRILTELFAAIKINEAGVGETKVEEPGAHLAGPRSA